MLYPFDFLGSSEFITMFRGISGGDYSAKYEKIAKALKKNDMYIEESSGLVINYGDTELGMNKEMLKHMIQHEVTILTASDAHVPQKVGMFIAEMNELIKI